MSIATIKGYAFEYFVRSLLIHGNFTRVTPDSQCIIYKAGAGLMIQGLGQSHNADVLMNPPIQIPFYFPSRLLVECKCYTDKLGLTFVRNVLGLREDINGFDVIDKDILKNRMNTRRMELNIFPFDRYQYQVALASLTGFKVTAQEFAYIHHIPLLSFQSSIFTDVRNAIFNLDQVQWSQGTAEEATKYLQSSIADGNECEQPIPKIAELRSLVEVTTDLVNRTQIAMLDDGTLLFLVRPLMPYIIGDDTQWNDGISLHWSKENRYWVLRKENEQYYFELPEKLFQIWATRAGRNRQEQAIHLKQEYFSNIVLFMSGDYGPELKVLHLSRDFIRNALNQFQNEH